MNWYFQVKLAALWDSGSDSDGDFDSELRRLYELEYKLSMLRSRPFNGMPQRQQNILVRLEEVARDAVGRVADELVPVFEKWLEGHALTNPNEWSNSQMELSEELHGDDFDSWWEGLMAFIQNYSDHPIPNYGQPNTDCSEIHRTLTELDNTGFEMFMRDWIYGEKENAQENMWSDWHSGHSEYETEEQLEAAIEIELAKYDQQTIGEYFASFGGDHCSATQEALRQVAVSTGVEPLFQILYSKIAFPKWFAYWQPQGIEDTRERVEYAYGLVQNAEATAESNITKALSDINIAIMTSHQTGGMMDYISEVYGAEDIESTMDELTGMTAEDLEPWNRALRDVGVQI